MDRANMFIADQPMILAPFGSDFLIYSLTGLHVLTALPDNGKCSKEKSLANCEAECRNDVIEKICGCSSSTLVLSEARAERKKPECSLDQYMQCLANFIGDEDSQCRKNCVGSCQQWQYFVDQRRVILYDKRSTQVSSNYKFSYSTAL